MPTIPSYLAREQLPGSSGVRGGVVGVPVTPQPGAPELGPTALERSLGALPQAVEQAGELQVHTELLGAQRQKLQDHIDANTTRQDMRPQLATLLDTLRQGPYQTLAKDFLTQADALIAQGGQNLNPQARALYQEKVKDDRDILHSHALAIASQRRDEALALTTMTEVQNTMDQYHRAGSDAERLMLKNNLQSLLAGFVDNGGMKGEVAAKLMADTEHGINLEQARMAVRADPADALQSLSARMKGGEVTNSAIAQVGTQYVSDLWDEATKQLEHRVTLQDHEQARQKRLLQDQQNLVSQRYGEVVYKANVTIPELLQAQEGIDKDARLQRLSETDQTRLKGHIQTMVQKLQDDAYKDRDVPEVAKSGWARVYAAQTPSDLDTAQRWINSNIGSLSSTTIQQMSGKIEGFRDKNSPLNDDVAKEARALFLKAAFPNGMVPAMMDKISAETQNRISIGMDLLNQSLQSLYDTQGRDAMRQQALEIARKMRDQYFPEGPGQTSALPASMPEVFKGIQYYEDGITLLDSLKDQFTQEQRRKYFLELKQLPRKPANLGTPTVPGLEKVPGYAKPKSPYAPLEQR